MMHNIQLASLIFTDPNGGLIWSIVIAFIGAVIVAFLYKKMTGKAAN